MINTREVIAVLCSTLCLAWAPTYGWPLRLGLCLAALTAFLEPWRLTLLTLSLVYIYIYICSSYIVFSNITSVIFCRHMLRRSSVKSTKQWQCQRSTQLGNWPNHWPSSRRIFSTCKVLSHYLSKYLNPVHLSFGSFFTVWLMHIHCTELLSLLHVSVFTDWRLRCCQDRERHWILCWLYR